MNTKKDILLRVYLSLLFFVAIGIVIVYRIMTIQYSEGKYWRSLSDSLSTSFFTIEATRGNIYSDDNNLMLTSLPIYEIRLDFESKSWKNNSYYNKNIDSLCIKLSELFGNKTSWEYQNAIYHAKRKNERYFLLKRNVNHNQLKILKEFPFFNQGRFLGGFIVERKSKRINPYRILASRTLGYKRKGLQGVGLEGAYNQYLSGKDGKRLMQKISGGNWIPINYANELDPEDGKDIVSTINISIQDVAENALLETLVKNEAQSGSVIVMEVETGHIKAIANLERNNNGTYSEAYNYAVGAATEPGSTFKLVSALILMEKANISANDIVDTEEGEHQFYDKVMKDAHSEGHGKITFEEAFAVSSNVAFSKLVFNKFSNSPDDFIKGIEDLHLTEPLGIPIAGEGIPVINRPSDKDWSGISLPWMSVGYGLQVTPLQLLTIYNAIANNGIMLKPLFATQVKRIGKVIEKFEPIVIEKKICSNKTVDYLQKMLEAVVEYGTANNIKTNLYKIAGKTGTALIANEGGYTKKKIYQASFAGYFPADNPKYSCIVVVTNPTTGNIYGAQVAAPVLKKIADKVYSGEFKNYVEKKHKVFNYSNIPIVSVSNKKDIINLSRFLGLDMILSSSLSEWVNINNEKKNIVLQNREINNAIVPDVRGMVLSDAIYLLENLGLKVEINGYGLILSQSIKPGTNVNYYSTIKLRLG
ncbi:MAG: penicillin-binding protein [Bacteroidota bacterium]|nr:penicillin-binding protein [Bacteroidota bacterium]